MALDFSSLPMANEVQPRPQVSGKPQTSIGGTFLREMGLNTPGVAAGLAAAEVAAPLGPVGSIVAGGGAALVTNYIGERGLDQLEQSSPIARDFLKLIGVDKGTREAGRREHEYAALAGQLAAGGPFFSPKAAMVQRLVSGGIQAGAGAGIRAVTGEDQDIKKSAIEFAGGMALPGKLTKFGEKVSGTKTPSVATSPESEINDAIASFKRKPKKDLEYEKVAIEPTTELGKSPETGLDYSEHAAEYRSSGLIEKEQSLDRIKKSSSDRPPQEIPTRGERTSGIPLELDEHGRLRRADTGIKGATPAVLRDFTSDLQSAVTKLSSGKGFDLSANEQVAWKKAQSDLQVVEPEFNTLSPKQVADRILDRNWVQQAIDKSRQMDRMFSEIQSSSRDRQAVQDAMRKREQLQDSLETLQELLGKGRSDSSQKQQGPKTLSAKEEARKSIKLDICRNK